MKPIVKCACIAAGGIALFAIGVTAGDRMATATHAQSTAYILATAQRLALSGKTSELDAFLKDSIQQSIEAASSPKILGVSIPGRWESDYQTMLAQIERK